MIFWMIRLFTGSAGDDFFTVCLAFILIGSVTTLINYAEDIRAFLERSVGRRGTENDEVGHRRYWSGWRRRYEQDWGGRPGGRDVYYPQGEQNPFIALFLVVLLLFGGMFLSSDWLFATFPHLFPFMIGVLPGCALVYLMDQRAMAENERSFLDACASYCPEAPESDKFPANTVS